MTSAKETFDPYAQWLGLNLREQPLDHYLLLGLDRFEADPAVIEQHADERMRLVRSFQTGPRGRYTQRLMNELAAAKLCLLSPAAKRAYDGQLALWLQGSGVSPAVNASAAAGEDDVAHRQLVEDEFAGNRELPPAALPSAAPAASVLSPPIAPPDYDLPPPPRAAEGEVPEDEESDAEPSSTISKATAAAGLLLGFLVMALTNWGVNEFLLKEKTAEVAREAAEPGDGAIDDSASTEPVEPPTASAKLPGSGRLELPEDGVPIEVLQEGSGDVVLSPATATLSGNTELSLEGTSETLAGWASPEDVATWEFRLIRPGFFQLQIEYAAGDAAFGRQLEVAIDEQAKSLEMVPSSEGYRTDVLTVAVPQSGPHTLQLRQTSAFDGELRVKLVRMQAVAR